MKHLVDPTPGADVVALPLPFKMEGASVRGTAIALQHTGNAMNYLIVSADAQTPPVWVPESEINLAYYGERPGSSGSPAP